ncbi:MAG: hypothetical protein WCK37_00705 [Candidatus Falkowbacteria bacterium]
MKIVFAVIAALIGVLAFLPYFRDIFRLKTKPHIYTWLIWAITQTTAIVGIIRGGGSWGALNLIVGTVFVVGIFLFSFKYGSKNITRQDTFVLFAALGAILVWWQLDKLTLAVIMVSIIDVLGYFPSFRKVYQEPWSETLSSWLLFSVSNIFAIMALDKYNLLTVTYLTLISLANIVMFLICFVRRRSIPK